MPSAQPAEVPSPIDFHELAQARAWVETTVRQRPWRPAFFAAFVDALNNRFSDPIAIAELGSGPGHLAAAVLAGCDVGEYIAVDFSDAMHALAKEHLGAEAARVTFQRRDFRTDDWMADIGPVDALITMQAAHEVRHKSRLPALLRQMRGIIRPGGTLLFCDHYTGGTKATDLFVSHDEQQALLSDAGFADVRELLDEGGMALLVGTRD